MRVAVLAFGILKDLLPQPEAVIDLPDGETVAGLLRRLEISASRQSASNATDLPAVWSALAVAVNRVYAGAHTILHDGDEVALLPPVSGGKGHP